MICLAPDPVPVMLGSQEAVLAIVVKAARWADIFAAVMEIVGRQSEPGIICSQIPELQTTESAASAVVTGIVCQITAWRQVDKEWDDRAGAVPVRVGEFREQEAGLPGYFSRQDQIGDVKDRDVPDPETSEEDKDQKELYAGEQKFYVYFHQPADVSKMTFLVWKHLDKDDDRWMYLPKIDLVKRIAGSEKRTSFVGSDYFYES